jgi:hypothetical protein
MKAQVMHTGNNFMEKLGTAGRYKVLKRYKVCDTFMQFFHTYLHETFFKLSFPPQERPAIYGEYAANRYLNSLLRVVFKVPYF